MKLVKCIEKGLYFGNHSMKKTMYFLWLRIVSFSRLSSEAVPPAAQLTARYLFEQQHEWETYRILWPQTLRKKPAVGCLKTLPKSSRRRDCKQQQRHTLHQFYIVTVWLEKVASFLFTVTGFLKWILNFQLKIPQKFSKFILSRMHSCVQINRFMG